MRACARADSSLRRHPNLFFSNLQEIRKDAAVFHQVAGRALLEHLSPSENEDIVQIFHRLKLVGDVDEGVPVAADVLFHAPLHSPRGSEVQCRQGFVQNQKAWPPQQCPRNCHPLLLAAAQVVPVPTDYAGVSVFERHDVIMDLTNLANAFDLFSRHILPLQAVFQVLQNRPVNQRGLLWHKAHHAGQVLPMDRAHINSRDFHRTLIRRVKSENRFDQRRFPRAGETHDTNLRPARDPEAALVEHLPPSPFQIVRKRNAFDLDCDPLAVPSLPSALPFATLPLLD
mmetsp:Transcript_10968/g.27685  ORF Transcript_10968/g.27685 Transcript_10968/m.27685 type:complete len:285 (-) Transcript_10968:353-1207(-)